MQEVQETQVQSLRQEDALAKGMVTRSSIIAWEILWTEKPGGLQSMGLQRVRHDLATERVLLHREVNPVLCDDLEGQDGSR